jgi:hypothetical protein
MIRIILYKNIHTVVVALINFLLHKSKTIYNLKINLTALKKIKIKI